LEERHIGEREAVMFVVVGQESQPGVLVLDSGSEHGFIPLQHLLEAAGAVNNVSELGRSNVRHDFSSENVP
jgi:hypothetical protein